MFCVDCLLAGRGEGDLEVTKNGDGSETVSCQVCGHKFTLDLKPKVEVAAK